jgi:hypothetical protein
MPRMAKGRDQTAADPLGAGWAQLDAREWDGAAVLCRGRARARGDAGGSRGPELGGVVAWPLPAALPRQHHPGSRFSALWSGKVRLTVDGKKDS